MNENRHGMGFGRGRGRGRQRVKRNIDPSARYRCFAPVCRENSECDSVFLRHDEIELLKLIDLDGLNQEEAAAILGVSRKTVWRDLHEARYKIADAVVNGKSMKILECDANSDEICRYFPQCSE